MLEISINHFHLSNNKTDSILIISSFTKYVFMHPPLHARRQTIISEPAEGSKRLGISFRPQSKHDDSGKPEMSAGVERLT